MRTLVLGSRVPHVNCHWHDGGVGVNATSMFVRAEGRLGPARVARGIVDVFGRAGVSLVDRQPLIAERWDRDRRLLGIGVSPVVAGWILVADTEREPSPQLASGLAADLAVPVVISSRYEICDPLEPQSHTVFGELPVEGGYPCFSRLGVTDYRDLVELPFDSDTPLFLTLRGDAIRAHSDAWSLTHDPSGEVLF